MYDKLTYAFDIAIGFIMLYMIGLAGLIQTKVPITPCFFVFDCVLFFLFSDCIFQCTFEIIPEKYRCLIDDGEFELRFWDVFLTILYILALIALYPHRNWVLQAIFGVD